MTDGDDDSGFIETPDHAYRVLVRELERLIIFQHQWHARILSLFIFLTHLKDIVPIVFYVALVGTKGTAKSSVLEVIRDICHQGVIFGKGSSPARIQRETNSGSTIIIDELDEVKGEVGDILEGMARHGYRRDSAIIGKWDLKRNTGLDLDPFGPKAFSFRRSIEDALLSRTYVIGMAEVRADDNLKDRIIDLAIRDEKNVRKMMTEICGRLKTEDGWTNNRVKGMMDSNEFRAEFKAITNGVPSARECELVLVCLMLSKVIGLNLEDEIRGVLEAQATFQSNELSELRDIIRDFWEERGKPPKAKISDIRSYVNSRRKEGGDPSYRETNFKGRLRDIKARDGIELRRVTGGPQGVYFTEEFVKSIYDEGSLAPGITSLFGFDPSLMPKNGQNGVTNGAQGVTNVVTDTPHVVTAQAEIVTVIRQESDILLLQSEGSNPSLFTGTFTLEDLAKRTGRWGIDESKLRKWIEDFSQQGIIYSPVLGRWKWI